MSEPQSGNFLGAADRDILSAALLYDHGRAHFPHAIYHGVQAVEKYLKARFLWVHEQGGTPGTVAFYQNEQLLRTHNLSKLYDAVEKSLTKRWDRSRGKKSLRIYPNSISALDIRMSFRKSRMGFNLQTWKSAFYLRCTSGREWSFGLTTIH